MRVEHTLRSCAVGSIIALILLLARALLYIWILVHYIGSRGPTGECNQTPSGLSSRYLLRKRRIGSCNTLHSCILAHGLAPRSQSEHTGLGQ